MSNRSRWVVLGAVVALALAGGWLWSQAGPGAEAGDAATDARPAAVAPADAEHSPPRFEAPREAAEPLAAVEAAPAPTVSASDAAAASDPSNLETLARLVGRVTLRGSDEPVAGLRVKATLSSEALVPAFTQPVTDADGRFQFALSEAAHATCLTVGSGPETRDLIRELDLDLALGAQVVQDLQVSRGATVSGHVVDGSDQPVAGARVRGWNHSHYTIDAWPDTGPAQEVSTDAAGAFSLGGLGPTFVLAHDAPGRTGLVRLSGELASGARVEDLTLTLGPARELRGLVLGPNEQPLPECAVAAEPEAGDRRDQLSGVAGVFRIPPAPSKLESDADGRFVLPGLAALAYDVRVTRDGHVPWAGQHAPGDADLVIRLGAGTTLSGEVLSVHGGPVADAEVAACSLAHGPWPRELQVTRTDAEGRFELTGLQADSNAALKVRGPGHAIRIEQPVEITETGPNHVRVVLDEARALGGQVVDADDRPVADVELTIVGDRIMPMDSGLTVTPLPTWEFSFGLREATTDSEGRFRFEQLYDGLFELSVAEPDGQGIAARLEARSGEEDLRIVLGAGPATGVTLVGSVRDGLTGLPVEAFSVVPMIPSGAGGRTGNDHDFEGPDGAFRLTGLEPGSIEVLVKAPGYSQLRVPERDYEAGEHRLDLQLLAERALRLRVVDEDQEPVDAKLSFLDEAGETLWIRSGPNAGTTNLKTDAAGEAIAMGLPAARITVHVKHGWFGSGQDFRFDLRQELRGTQVLVLGDDGQATVLVFFFGAAQPPAFDPSQGFQVAMEGLHGQVLAGQVGPIETAITVRALSSDGKVVAEQLVDPSVPTEASTAVPDVSGVCNLHLTVPAEPLEFEVSAPGYETARRAWQPDRASDEDDVIVLVLRKL